MRIIGGRVKGRRLKTPRGRALRPTAARVKEAVFDILPRDLSGCRVLDLFAGTGNLSMEALSRGAAEALLIDASRSAAKAIRDNLRSLGLASQATVWTVPVLRSLRILGRRGRRFELVFVDPPYEKNLLPGVLRTLAQTELLEESGVIVVEHSTRESVDQSYGRLILQDQRRYGTTLVSFFARSSLHKLSRDR
jgi:16S rRNA (guanine(966)-N(2))-methyltransferase RsmD